MLVMGTAAFAAKFPKYLKVKGTTIVECDRDKLPVDLVIPEGITEIGFRAFYGSSIKSVTIPDSVRKIGKEAFYWCKSLVSITIPGSVKEIDKGAFSWCESLVNVTIEEGVNTIGDNAFLGCKHLKSVRLPRSVSHVGRRAFDDCPYYMEVQFGGTMAQWKAISNDGYINDYFQIVHCTDGNLSKGKQVFPKYLTMDGTTISKVANISDVEIPSGVTAIRSRAFGGNHNLSRVRIPVSVKSIEENAFYNCVSVKAQFDGTMAQWRAIAGSGKDALSTVSCKDGTIGVKGEIPSYLKMYGTVIIGCDRDKRLENITIPEGTTEIKDRAFEGCDSLKGAQFSGTIAQWKAINGNEKEKLGVVYCKDGIAGVKNIPSYLVMQGTKIVGCDKDALPDNLTIPDGVTEIAGEAFRECMYLESVMIPGSVKRISSGTNYRTINEAKGAFMGCTSLKSVVFMEGVEEIGDDAFLGCLSLANVTIPGSMKRIGHRAFMDCKALANITLPEGITEIGTGAFSGAGLKSVTIPGSVTSIGSFVGTMMTASVYREGAFYSCTSLESVTILGGAVIGERAFMGCTALRTVTISEGVTTIGAMAFLGCTSLTSIVIPSGVTAINGGVFSGCTSLAKVTIPDTVKEINSSAYTGGDGDSNGYGAFSGCTSLTSITIPENVTEIGDYAFCASGLTSVTIPGRVKHIGYFAFAGCESLTSVTIPRGVSGIGGSAFAGCKNLRSISIPRSVVEMGGNVFGNGKFNQYFNERLFRVEHRYSDDYIKEPVIPYSNLTIQFDGTKAQWKFEKQDWDESWHGRLSHNFKGRYGYYQYRRAVIIRCTDGDIAIPE